MRALLSTLPLALGLFALPAHAAWPDALSVDVGLLLHREAVGNAAALPQLQLRARTALLSQLELDAGYALALAFDGETAEAVTQRHALSLRAQWVLPIQAGTVRLAAGPQLGLSYSRFYAYGAPAPIGAFTARVGASASLFLEVPIGRVPLRLGSEVSYLARRIDLSLCVGTTFDLGRAPGGTR